MLRAIVTAAVMVVLVVLLGIPLLLIGLIYPSQRAMALATVIWARGILFCSGVKLTVVGRERIADGAARFFFGEPSERAGHPHRHRRTPRAGAVYG